MNQKIKIAFVGAGYMAKEHLKALNNTREITFSGIMSKTTEKCHVLSKEFNIAKVCSTVAELWQNDKPDVLVITVPELATREICLEAFKYPWKILVEKPAGYNLADSAKILEAAKTSEMYVALNRRLYSSTLELHQQLSTSSGRRLIQITDQEDARAALKAGQPELVVKNWMFANSIHLIDLFRFLGRGNVVQVENLSPWRGIESDFVSSKITFSSGDIGLYTAVWNRPGPWKVSVNTDDKYFELKPIEMLGVQPYGTRKLEPIATHTWDTDFKPGLRLMAQEIIKLARGENHSLVSLIESHKSMELVSKIYENNLL